MRTTLATLGLLDKLQSRQPLLWLNPRSGEPLPEEAPAFSEIAQAEATLTRCEPLMAVLFPELKSCAGRVESPLMAADTLKTRLFEPNQASGTWFLKRDDALPVAGSVKARGGFHEVLSLAEAIAIEQGLIDKHGDRRLLASSTAKKLFSQYTIAVGSTGNLGLSIGVIAAALGFKSVVHMSADAKKWKKERLVKRGVRVVEHPGDYAKAVASGRATALSTPQSHFVDDESSPRLFFGYAAAARHLAYQLSEAGRVIDANHPLFVYLPCGVGGAPGGITYGLKALFGNHVHCFFAEPVASPCMLVQLASESNAPFSVYDVGLDNRTDADGLAVGQASSFVSPLMASQLAGVFTVSDEQLYIQLLILKQSLGIDLEPSAAAGIGGPGWLINSAEGQEYIRGKSLNISLSTHVIWATGGSLVPQKEHCRFQAHAEKLIFQKQMVRARKPSKTSFS